MGLKWVWLVSKLLEYCPPFRFWGPFFPSGARAPSLLPHTQLLRAQASVHQPVAHGIRDSSLLLQKLCELSWPVLEKGMLFIFILCMFCRGLLIPCFTESDAYLNT